MARRFSLAVLAVVSVAFIPCAQAEPVLFAAELSGAEEVPANTSPGTGLALVTFDPVAHTLRVQATFSGLLGVTAAAHIHSPINPATGLAGVATQVPFFEGFPIGVMSGTYARTFDTLDLATYNPTYVTNNGGTAASAEVALFTQMSDGLSYFNIHTDMFPGGEIRGTLQVVPEPSTAALAALGALGLLGYGWRRRSRRSG
jgi:hypothetical protein